MRALEWVTTITLPSSLVRLSGEGGLIGMVNCEKADDGTYTLSGLSAEQIVGIHDSFDDFEVEQAISDQLFAEKVERTVGPVR